MTSQNQNTITAEDLYEFKLISSPRISPDGKHVVYALQRVDRKTEKKFSNLWIVPTSGGEAYQFTYGDHTDSNPRWSPDGKHIAFLSNRDDEDKPAKIFTIPFDGGEAHWLSTIEGTISEFAWSPNGEKLLCRVRKTDQEVLEREEDEQKKELGVVYRRYDRVFYKLDDDGYLPQERWHIWIVDSSTGEAEQLTNHPVFDENHPTWSPDGQYIAFTSNRSESPDLNPDEVDIYTISVQGGEITKIHTPFGEKSHPSYSPDGNWIAYYGKEGQGHWYKNINLWVVPAHPRANDTPARNLTESYDLHVSPAVINDLGQPELIAPTWSNDSQTLYFPMVYHGSSLLKSISLQGEDLQTVIDEGGVVGSFSFDQTQTNLAYFYGKMEDPGQIYLLPMDRMETHRLTKINHELLAGINLGETEEIWIDGPAGNPLQGWILKPPGFNPSKKYPSILEIHGGPLTQYGYFFMHEFYYLAAHGYVIHFCNPRGGRGYGQGHAKAIWSSWGGADYDDLMAWTDHIAKLPYIDSERMGVTGGSYGGYMTVWIIGHTQRFKAAVTQRCVSNFISMWGSSDLNWIFQQELDAKPPFDDLDKYWDHSPIKYIGNATTPTMVIHSENDLRCPIEQGEQVFVALQKLGIDSEMIRFPDEFHGLSRAGRTDRRIARLNHILRWFDLYLGNRSDRQIS